MYDEQSELLKLCKTSKFVRENLGEILKFSTLVTAILKRFLQNALALKAMFFLVLSLFLKWSC